MSYTLMARGGHFAAMEEPQLLAEDVQNFTKRVEKKQKWAGGSLDRPTVVLNIIIIIIIITISSCKCV